MQSPMPWATAKRVGAGWQCCAVLRSRKLWVDPRSSRFTRSARHSVSKNRRGRGVSKYTEAALAIWQSSTPGRGMLMPGNDEDNLIASENGRVEQ
jgi:hypothetical protein